MIAVEVLVAIGDETTVTVRLEAARPESGLTSAATARRLVDRANAAAMEAVDPPTARGVYVDPVAG